MQTLPKIGIPLLAALVSLPAMAKDKNPYAKVDDSWISISGTAASPTADSFTLDYGDGTILVEVDDWDSYGEAAPLIDGDKVVVYGKIDDDLYERHKIEASSVYVENLGTYFYASAADEEGAPYMAATRPVVVKDTTLRGTVSKVSPAMGEFTVDVGKQAITVEIERLTYNPLDAYGFQKIEKGDVVSVSGEFDHDFVEGRVFDAEMISTLVDESKTSKSMN